MGVDRWPADLLVVSLEVAVVAAAAAEYFVGFEPAVVRAPAQGYWIAAPGCLAVFEGLAGAVELLAVPAQVVVVSCLAALPEMLLSAVQ